MSDSGALLDDSNSSQDEDSVLKGAPTDKEEAEALLRAKMKSSLDDAAANEWQIARLEYRACYGDRDPKTYTMKEIVTVEEDQVKTRQVVDASKWIEELSSAKAFLPVARRIAREAHMDVIFTSYQSAVRPVTGMVYTDFGDLWDGNKSDRLTAYYISSTDSFEDKRPTLMELCEKTLYSSARDLARSIRNFELFTTLAATRGQLIPYVVTGAYNEMRTSILGFIVISADLATLAATSVSPEILRIACKDGGISRESSMLAEKLTTFHITKYLGKSERPDYGFSNFVKDLSTNYHAHCLLMSAVKVIAYGDGRDITTLNSFMAEATHFYSWPDEKDKPAATSIGVSTYDLYCEYEKHDILSVWDGFGGTVADILKVLASLFDAEQDSIAVPTMAGGELQQLDIGPIGERSERCKHLALVSGRVTPLREARRVDSIRLSVGGGIPVPEMASNSMTVIINGLKVKLQVQDERICVRNSISGKVWKVIKSVNSISIMMNAVGREVPKVAEEPNDDDVVNYILRGKCSSKAAYWVLAHIFNGKVKVRRDSPKKCYVPSYALSEKGVLLYTLLGTSVTCKFVYITDGEKVYWWPRESASLFQVSQTRGGSIHFDPSDDEPSRAESCVLRRARKVGNDRHRICAVDCLESTPQGSSCAPLFKTTIGDCHPFSLDAWKELHMSSCRYE